MNDEQFEKAINKIWLFSPSMADQLRARDTAQREALARAEAERDAARNEYEQMLINSAEITNAGMRFQGKWKLAQAQLADVLYILDQHRAWTGMGWEQLPVPVHAVEKIRSKLAQAEHQEAQGAQAGEFQREDRYIVIKRKDLDQLPMEMRLPLSMALNELAPRLPKRECLVIESDWPEYEPAWAAIQARVEGRAAQPAEPDEVDRFFEQAKAELRRARAKFPGDRIMTLALAEEFGELCKAVLDESAEAVRKEAVQVACMAARVVLDGDGSVVDWRRERGLDPLLAAVRGAEQ